MGPRRAPQGRGPRGRDLPRAEAEDDAIDLLDVAAGPVLKRVLPADVVAALIVLAIRLRRGLRRRPS